MKSYKDSSFQARASQAAEARAKALEQLRSRPPLDANLVAERKAASGRRETAKAAAKKAKERAATEAAVADASAKAAAPRPLSEAERKAERDARYAARKRRK